jgi:hypothetical protein
MSYEALYYQDFTRLGHEPSIKKLTKKDLADTSLAARIAYGQAIGACGYRSVRDPAGCIWYWPRLAANWWIIPDSLDEKIQAVKEAAIDSAMSNGRATAEAIAMHLRQQVASSGYPTSILDARVSGVIFPLPGGGKTNKKTEKRIAQLLQQRNSCEEREIDMIDFELIEIARGLS